jgi:hypothetical protein
MIVCAFQVTLVMIVKLTLMNVLVTLALIMLRAQILLMRSRAHVWLVTREMSALWTVTSVRAIHVREVLSVSILVTSHLLPYSAMHASVWLASLVPTATMTLTNVHPVHV